MDKYVSTIVLMIFFNFTSSNRVLSKEKFCQKFGKECSESDGFSFNENDHDNYENHESPPVSYITTCGVGGLGNQMSSFATMYALNLKYGPEIFLQREYHELFMTYFKSDYFIKTIKLRDRNSNKFRWIKPFRKYDFSNSSLWKENKYGKYINLGVNPNSMHLYMKHFEELKNIFQLKDEFIHVAQNRLRRLSEEHKIKLGIDAKTKAALTFISIHVRRTDYEENLQFFLKMKLSDQHYIKSAVEFYRNKFQNQNILFYVVSDDFSWCQKNILDYGDDIYFIGVKDKEEKEEEDSSISTTHTGIDLALLSQANHSIMTHGTFGLWGALMAGGTAVLPKSHLVTDLSNEVIEAKMPDWEFV